MSPYCTIHNCSHIKKSLPRLILHLTPGVRSASLRILSLAKRVDCSSSFNFYVWTNKHRSSEDPSTFDQLPNAFGQRSINSFSYQPPGGAGTFSQRRSSRGLKHKLGGKCWKCWKCWCMMTLANYWQRDVLHFSLISCLTLFVEALSLQMLQIF